MRHQDIDKEERELFVAISEWEGKLVAGFLPTPELALEEFPPELDDED
jgi:hypothetical protein